jgi:uncharacterized protein
MLLQRLFMVVIAMIAFSVCGEDRPATVLPTRTLTMEGASKTERLVVELATTGAQQQQGLMFRQLMPEDAGMLFLFGRETRGGFWMKDTYIPLDIAYLARDGTVQQIFHAKPLDTTILAPAQPYWHVIELNAGWFERHGMGVGSRLEIPEDLAPR